MKRPFQALNARDHIRARDPIAQPHPRQPISLGEAVDDDNISPVFHMADRIRQAMFGGELVIDLIIDQGHMVGQTVQNSAQNIFAKPGAGGVVRVAQIHQPGLRRYGSQDTVNIHRIIRADQIDHSQSRALFLERRHIGSETRWADDRLGPVAQYGIFDEGQNLDPAIGGKEVIRCQPTPVKLRQCCAKRCVGAFRVKVGVLQRRLRCGYGFGRRAKGVFVRRQPCDRPALRELCDIAGRQPRLVFHRPCIAHRCTPCSSTFSYHKSPVPAVPRNRGQTRPSRCFRGGSSAS